MPDEGLVRPRERNGGKQAVVPEDEETIQTFERFKSIQPTISDSEYLILSTAGIACRRRRYSELRRARLSRQG